MFSAIRYLWNITRGYRLRPWQSPYVHWRLETYFGKAGQVRDGVSLFRLLWRERRELRRFLAWVAERQAEQRRRTSD